MLTSGEGFVKGFCGFFQDFTALLKDGKMEFNVPMDPTQKTLCHSEPVRRLVWESPK